MTGDANCPDVDHLASDNWILSNNMLCNLGVYRYEGTGLLQIRSGSVACGNGTSSAGDPYQTFVQGLMNSAL